ncbi:MAG: hypothetical protein HDR44_04195 [Allobaculum sp.]|nr:hypothetical protein [Allobaculum sp.]
MKPLHSLLTAFCCVSLMCGCMESPSNQSTSSDSSTSSSQSLQPVELEASDQDGYNRFAWTLFKNTLDENTLISPLSAFFALGLVANGASGETLNQLEEVLGMSLESFNAFCSDLLKNLANDPQAQMKLANCIWLDPDRIESLQAEFEAIAKQDYEAEVFLKSFNSNTVNDINAWVSTHTNDLIKEMMSQIPSDTVMILINALAFEAEWLKVYEENAIQTQPFFNADGSSSEVKMMYSEESSYFEVEGLHGFLKPYQNDHYGLALLIPQDDSSLEDVLQKADGQAILKALATPQVRTVETGLPQFSLEDSKTLNESLQKAGLSDAFLSEKADFSKLATNHQDLAISEVFQKTKIIVDAKGTQAAAATEIMINETAAVIEDDSIQIVCDRPFFYALLDLQTKTPILMGTVNRLS